MIKGYDRHTEHTINGICNTYIKTQDINAVMKCYPGLDYNVILSILYSNEIHLRLEPCQLNITDKKIIFISDTHYGSEYDNINYANYVFDFAAKKGINTVFHGGDVIEGSVSPKDGFCSKKQAEYFLENYPYDKSIMTYAILGNHDYIAIRGSSKTKNILNSRDDIDIMGFKKVYFKWNGYNIGMSHEIKKYRLCFPTFDEKISFRGHSHFFHTRDLDGNGDREAIYMPAMCDDPIPKVSTDTLAAVDPINFKPGFLVVENYGPYVIINHYFFEDKKINIGNRLIKTLS